MSKPPSKKQLGYLKGLGYRGTPPKTSWEASQLIGELKAGKSPNRAAKNLNKNRENKANRALEGAREYVRLVAEQNEEYHEAVGSAMVAGFRLKVSKAEMTLENEVYHRAFLPLEVAVKYPEILAVAGVEDEELQRVPGQGKFVVKPGEVIERKKGEPVPGVDSGGGCLGIVVFAGTLTWFLLKMVA